MNNESARKKVGIENAKKIIQNEQKLKEKMQKSLKKQSGITLIALVVTVLFSYDEKLKCSNSKGFLLTTI